MIHLILLSFFSISIPQDADTHELIIEVSNIETPAGELKIAIFNNEEDHLRNSISGSAFKISEKGTLRFSFQLPYGEYSFTMYQDVDSNGELNSNFIGIPNEPFAFSNNASIMFGPPSYEKSKFNFSKEHQIEFVKLK